MEYNITLLSSTNSTNLGITMSLASQTSGKIIVVEGVPGVGKTTFCTKYAEENSGVVVFPEVFDPKILKEYITDMSSHAFKFQTSMQESTLVRIADAITEAGGGKTVLIDRGLVGNQCFAEVQHQQGFITIEELALYLSKNLYPCSIETWYLVASVDTVLARIEKRNRDGESAYTRDYIETLINKHNELLLCDKNVKVLDLEN